MLNFSYDDPVRIDEPGGPLDGHQGRIVGLAMRMTAMDFYIVRLDAPRSSCAAATKAVPGGVPAPDGSRIPNAYQIESPSYTYDSVVVSETFLRKTE